MSRNYAHYRILQNGPTVASFEVSYDPWPVGVDRKVWETRRFTLPEGTNFTRMVSTLSSDKPGPLIIGIGIADFDDYLVLVKVKPGRPFVYYAGATWSHARELTTREEWRRYVAEQHPDFDPDHE